MSNRRWRIEFVEVAETLPVLWRPGEKRGEPGPTPGELAISALMSAFDLLARRGSGESPWRTFFQHDPVAFLLDAMGDAVSLWRQSGELVYRNRAADRLGFGWGKKVAHEAFTSAGKRFERRCLNFRHGSAHYVLEIIREGEETTESSKSRESLGQRRSRRGSKRLA